MVDKTAKLEAKQDDFVLIIIFQIEYLTYTPVACIKVNNLKDNNCDHCVFVEPCLDGGFPRAGHYPAALLLPQDTEALQVGEVLWEKLPIKI